jgi:hypothetical protein
MKLITHLYLVSSSRMRGAIPQLPQYAFMAWCSVEKNTWTNLPLPLLLTLRGTATVGGSLKEWKMKLASEARQHRCWVILSLCEKNVLRKILGSKTEEVAGKWGKIHDEELHSLWPITSGSLGWTGHKARVSYNKWIQNLSRKIWRE